MRITVLLMISALFISQSFAQKKAITFEDFFSMKRIRSISVSPNGEKAAIGIRIADIENNSYKTDIWILDLETNKLSQFTKCKKSSTHPVWAPNGKDIYFNRAGQVWKKNSENGNADAVQITKLELGAGNVEFNANGSKMLFVSDSYPECETEECNKKAVAKVKSAKSSGKIIDQLMFRHWNRWLEGKRSHVFLANADGSESVDITPGDFDTPPLDLGGHHDYGFSPDGDEIAYVKNTDKMVAASTNNDIFLYSVKDKFTRRLTNNKGNDNNPIYSPDGQYIAYASMERAGFEADRYRIMLYQRTTGKTIELTTRYEHTIYSILWHPNSREIYFTSPEEGMIHLYKVNIKSSKIQPVLKGHYINGLQFVSENELLFAKQTAAMPKEIFTYNLKTKNLTQKTQLNKETLDNLELGKLEAFWFTGAKGDKVQGFLIKPPFFDKNKKYPAVELIHGGPQGAWGDDYHYRWNYQMFASPGYVVFMINFHGSRGYGQKFTDAVSKDWGGAPYEDILKGTEYVLNKYDFIDKNKVGAAGASYGGFMINWIAGAEHPFACLVSHDGVYEQVSMYGATEELWFPEWEFGGKPWEKESLYQKWNPANRAANFKTPTLVIHGEHDYRVPYTQGLQMFSALQRQGVKSRLLFFPDEDHFVTKPQNAKLWWETVHGWFKEFLEK
jgi:dipeptidyl aminopeptidase/acylaminoacyl peptidase